MSSPVASLVEEQQSRMVALNSVNVVQSCRRLEVPFALEKGGYAMDHATAGPVTI